VTSLADLPKTRAEIEPIQSDGKRRALAQARRAPFYTGKLDRVNADRLDDPDEWRKIPFASCAKVDLASGKLVQDFQAVEMLEIPLASDSF